MTAASETIRYAITDPAIQEWVEKMAGGRSLEVSIVQPQSTVTMGKGGDDGHSDTIRIDGYAIYPSTDWVSGATATYQVTAPTALLVITIDSSLEGTVENASVFVYVPQGETEAEIKSRKRAFAVRQKALLREMGLTNSEIMAMFNSHAGIGTLVQAVKLANATIAAYGDMSEALRLLESVDKAQAGLGRKLSILNADHVIWMAKDYKQLNCQVTGAIAFLRKRLSAPPAGIQTAPVPGQVSPTPATVAALSSKSKPERA